MSKGLKEVRVRPSGLRAQQVQRPQVGAFDMFKNSKGVSVTETELRVAIGEKVNDEGLRSGPVSHWKDLAFL